MGFACLIKQSITKPHADSENKTYIRSGREWLRDGRGNGSLSVAGTCRVAQMGVYLRKIANSL